MFFHCLANSKNGCHCLVRCSGCKVLCCNIIFLVFAAKLVALKVKKTNWTISLRVANMLLLCFIQDFREKNTDHMRPDIVALLKSSKNAFICGLMGIDPVATFRWAVLRAYFRAVVAFREAGRRHTHKNTGDPQSTMEPEEVWS